MADTGDTSLYLHVEYTIGVRSVTRIKIYDFVYRYVVVCAGRFDFTNRL